MTDTKTPPADDLVRRLRNTPNWLRQDYGNWKDSTSHYDRAPFEAADAIEALTAERVDWARRFKLNDVTPWEWMTRAEAAERRAAAAEGDAKRYRWLREQAGTVSPRASTVFRKNGEWANVWDGASLDAAIDTRMAESAAIAAQDAGKT